MPAARVRNNAATSTHDPPTKRHIIVAACAADASALPPSLTVAQSPEYVGVKSRRLANRCQASGRVERFEDCGWRGQGSYSKVTSFVQLTGTSGQKRWGSGWFRTPSVRRTCNLLPPRGKAGAEVGLGPGGEGDNVGVVDGEMRKGE